MFIDNNTILAVAAIISALAALTAACYTRKANNTARKALKQESERADFTMKVNVLLRFDEYFKSEYFRKTRKQAAEVLTNPPDSKNSAEWRPVDDIFNFFEQVAKMTNIGALDLEMVRCSFSYWMDNYSYFSKERVQDVTKDKKNGIWENFVWLQAELSKKSGEKFIRNKDIFLNEEKAIY